MAQARTSILRVVSPAAQAPAPFTIAPRLDLRTGAVAAGVVEPREALAPDAWLAAIADARRAWIGAGYAAPLSALAPQAFIAEPAAASVLDTALRAAGFAMRGFTVEVEEAALMADRSLSMAALERLRARGWGVALRAAPDCPLPIGGRTRAVFTDILAEAPADMTPFLGLEGLDEAPLARRIRAAANSGLNVTATGLHTMAFNGLLIAAGFDRGEGPGLKVRAFA
jgi:hypothetical protein